jgi:hypothetical protein
MYDPVGTGYALLKKNNFTLEFKSVLVKDYLLALQDGLIALVSLYSIYK